MTPSETVRILMRRIALKRGNAIMIQYSIEELLKHSSSNDFHTQLQRENETVETVLAIQRIKGALLR